LGLCGKTASATNAEERLYFFFPLRLCAFAGNSIGNECGAKTLLLLPFAALRLCGKQHRQRMRRKDSTSSFLCVFGALRENSICDECGGKTLLRLSFAPLRLCGKQHRNKMRSKDSISSFFCGFGLAVLRRCALKTKISEFNPRFLNTDRSKESRQFVAVERAIGAQTAANVNSERFYFLNSVGNVVRF